MGKSTNGPDWTDVATTMSAVGSLHGCKVGLIVTADTEGHNGQLKISLHGKFDVVPGSGLEREVVVSSEWPCKDCSTMAGHLYGGLLTLDYLIGQAYRQARLPGAE